jgi:hypothetical protein
MLCSMPHSDIRCGKTHQDFARQHSGTFELEEEEHKHEYMQVYQVFQDDFEVKLEAFLTANGYTQEHLLSVVDAAEQRQGSSSEPSCDIAAAIVASLEYDVFLEMIQMVKRGR